MANSVLIASASAGTGHLRAAEAVRTALLARGDVDRVEHVDVLELAPAWVRAAYRDGFELLAARAPGVWREIYHLTDGPGTDGAHWGALAQRLLFRAFDRVVRGQSWDACLSTHFLPAQLLAGRDGAPPFGMAITDFALHRYWAQPGVRQYFTATDALADEVRARVRGARVDTTGIPVRTDLLEGPTRGEAVRALGLDRERPVVLAMGGGLGIGVTGLALGAAAAGSGAQIVALCGRSDAARTALDGVEDIRALGYVNDIRPWLAAADVIVTKPGGVTVSEAIALGRPLVLGSPIPGHEEENRRVLVRAGAALAADSPEQVAAAVRMLVAEPDRRAEIAAAARAVGRPHAAQAVAALVAGRWLLRDVA